MRTTRALTSYSSASSSSAARTVMFIVNRDQKERDDGEIGGSGRTHSYAPLFNCLDHQCAQGIGRELKRVARFGLVKPEDGYSCLSSLAGQTFHLVTFNEGLTAGLAQSKAHALVTNQTKRNLSSISLARRFGEVSRTTISNFLSRRA